MSKTISPELRDALKRLRLGRILDTLSDRLLLAEQEELSFEETLLRVLVDEINRRQGSASARRAHDAHLDPDMVLERWDRSASVQFDRKVFHELCSLRFLQSHHNVVVLGPVGVGKTFIANALGNLACRAGFKVRFQRADALLRELRQSRLDNSRDDLMIELTTIDLLIVDDFALEPMNRDESRDVYQLIVERNARASTIVTSNRDTSEWIAMFSDTLIAQSAVDRFKNNAFDLVVEGESYRPKMKPVVADNPSQTPVVKSDRRGHRRESSGS